MDNQKFYCYILCNTNEKYKNHTYCGFTTNLERRIRQHNREIKGGAKATAHGAGSWKFFAFITGFINKQNALSCEWRLKHPNCKRRKNKEYYGIQGRIKTLLDVLMLDKWTENCDVENSTCNYILYILEDVYTQVDFTCLPKNIVIEKIN
jgi:predicted GIY-YIG superfamily endonuclease